MNVDLNHLHLHVRDQARSTAFYEDWFGFREHMRHGDLLFLRNGDDFDLALAPDPEGQNLPGWFHFGFRLPSPDGVRELHARMTEAGIPQAKPLYEDDTLVSFTCYDPDGYRVEVYWE